MIGRTLAIFFIATSVLASEIDVSVTKPPKSAWGNQTADLKMTNNTEDYKFVVATAYTRFIGGEYQPSRFAKVSHFIEPSSSIDITLPIMIPPGYGNAAVDIAVYDVIDTLDQIFDSQKFYTRSIVIKFPLPETLKEEVSLDIAVPKFVENTWLFDNSFTRVLMLLLDRGKSYDEIAELCLISPEYLESAIGVVNVDGYLETRGSQVVPKFMIIEKDKVQRIRPLINETVENLYGIITSNMAGFDSSVSAMVSSGALTSDKYDALNGGTILYHKYPVMLALFLWDILGREFVNDGRPFDIFENSDPCNAFMGDFMYMVADAGNNVGDSYFYFVPNIGREVIYCGIGKHNIDCERGYREKARRNQRVGWRLREDEPDLVFIYNEDKIRAPLSLLMDGTFAYVDKLKTGMNEIFAGEKYDRFGRGARYWCWDLVVTALMHKFEAEKIMEREANGIFRFQKVDY